MNDMIGILLSKHQHRVEAEKLVRSRANDKGGTAAWLFHSTTVSPLTAADVVPEVLTDEWADSVIEARLSWWWREGKCQYEEWQNRGNI